MLITEIPDRLLQAPWKAEEAPCPFSVLDCISRRKRLRPACVHPAQKVRNKFNPCKEILPEHILQVIKSSKDRLCSSGLA